MKVYKIVTSILAVFLLEGIIEGGADGSSWACKVLCGKRALDVGAEAACDAICGGGRGGINPSYHRGGGGIMPKSTAKRLSGRFSMGVNANFAVSAKFGGSNTNEWGNRHYGKGYESYDKHSNNFYWEVNPSFSVGVNAEFSMRRKRRSIN